MYANVCIISNDGDAKNLILVSVAVNQSRWDCWGLYGINELRI